MQSTLPKISPHLFEKHPSPLTLVKPTSQFVSPRSINEFSNLTRALKAQHLDEDQIPRMKEPFGKSKHTE